MSDQNNNISETEIKYSHGVYVDSYVVLQDVTQEDVDAIRPVLEAGLLEDKRGGGRDPKWKDAESLQATIEEYFAWAKENKKPLTLERLCVYLECDIETLRNYAKRDEFFGTIQKAVRIILADKVERMLNNESPVNASKFDLAVNHRYREPAFQIATPPGEPLEIKKDGQIISDEALAAIGNAIVRSKRSDSE